MTVRLEMSGPLTRTMEKGDDFDTVSANSISQQEGHRGQHEFSGSQDAAAPAQFRMPPQQFGCREDAVQHFVCRSLRVLAGPVFIRRLQVSGGAPGPGNVHLRISYLRWRHLEAMDLTLA